MRERPDGAELLDLAGSELRDSLLRLLPAEHRHTALMIGNAMAVAARQLRAGDAPLLREYESLCRLLGRPADGAPRGEALASALLELNRELVLRIRGADEAGLAAIHAHLRAEAERRVRESNPAYLDSDPPG